MLGPEVSESRLVDVVGTPPTVVVGIFVALVAGSFAYVEGPGDCFRPEPCRSSLGPAPTGEAAAERLTAHVACGRPAADLSDAGDSLEALL
jgi:hypothetical protein